MSSNTNKKNTNWWPIIIVTSVITFLMSHSEAFASSSQRIHATTNCRTQQIHQYHHQQQQQYQYTSSSTLSTLLLRGGDSSKSSSRRSSSSSSSSSSSWFQQQHSTTLYQYPSKANGYDLSKTTSTSTSTSTGTIHNNDNSNNLGGIIQNTFTNNNINDINNNNNNNNNKNGATFKMKKQQQQQQQQINNYNNIGFFQQQQQQQNNLYTNTNTNDDATSMAKTGITSSSSGSSSSGSNDNNNNVNGASYNTINNKNNNNNNIQFTTRGGGGSYGVLNGSMLQQTEQEQNEQNDDDDVRNNNNQSTTTTTSTAVQFVAETKLPTKIGQFQLRAYRIPGSPIGYQEPCVIYSTDKPPFGTTTNNNNDNNNIPVPVRIHDQCLTSEVFGSQRCDCKEQLNMALQYIKANGGFIIYLQQEGRGIGLANKIAAYSLQDTGMDTVDANIHLGFPDDAREYTVVPSILHDMNIQSIVLLTNNPRKTKLLRELGVSVVQTIPMVIPQTNQYNHKYMETKVNRMDHMNMAQLLLQQRNNNNVNNNKKKNVNKQQPLDSEQEMNDSDNDIDVDDVDTINSRNVNDISTVTPVPISNGMTMMSPRFLKHPITGGSQQLELEQIINGDSNENTLANGVTVTSDLQDDTNEQIGILANDDGYCLGKQTVIDAIEAIKRGEMIVVVDDLDRENEGDFIMAADMCTGIDMARIIRYSSGVVCVGMESQRMDELKLPAMVSNNEDPKGTAFSVSVDATKDYGITTGISATDRAITIQLLANPVATASSFNRPGHIFPLRAAPGGVLQRNGHTEASVDFAKLAGLNPAGVLCEIVSEENPTEMMRLPEIKRFCARNQFVLTSIADLVQYRKELEAINNNTNNSQ